MHLDRTDGTRLYLEVDGPDEGPVVGYSLGPALVLLALQAGPRVDGAVVAGGDDHIAAPVDELVARLPNATAHQVPGDHFTAAGTTEFAARVLAAAGA